MREAPQMYLVRFPDRLSCWCWLGTDETTGESAWVDMKGRRIPHDAGTPAFVIRARHVHETFEVPPMFRELLRESAERYLIDPRSDQGWIDPRGVFYGCRFFQHDDLATSFFGCLVSALENDGYVRVHADTIQVARDHEPNEAQVKTLGELGFLYSPEFATTTRRMKEGDRTGISRKRLYVPGGRVQAPPLGQATANVVERRTAARRAAGLEP